MHLSNYFSDDNPYADPPDIFDLFQFYNSYFFENVLHSTVVKWSKRMTLCAGTCKYEGQQSCVITLSEPLLKFRSNNELKETILHEMIHAYLFIKCPGAERIDEGHGPPFLQMMEKINQATGLHISVYHQFHDEVDRCRNHIWRCDGACQQKPPFFGFVKRAVNRPPGQSDYWFVRHQRECGGTFIKVSEPEKQPKQPQKRKSQKQAKQEQEGKAQKKIEIPKFFQPKKPFGCIVHKQCESYEVGMKLQVDASVTPSQFLEQINHTFRLIAEALKEVDLVRIEFDKQKGKGDLLDLLKNHDYKIFEEIKLMKTKKKMMIKQLLIGWKEEAPDLIMRLNDVLI